MSLDSIIAWEVPAQKFSQIITAQPESISDDSITNDKCNGKWLIDRFTETYLDRWDTESLCREWSFIHGQIAPPCSPFELKSREVKVLILSQEMSDRLVKTNKIQSKKM